MPPEQHIFNPSDQSVDKSPCRPCIAIEYNIAVKNILAKPCASPGSGSIDSSEKPTVRTSENSPLPKKGREKLSSLLADLLGFPSADRQPEAKTKRLNLYESMSPRFGNELKSPATGTCVPIQDLQQDRRSAIYENCLKCQGEHCHPPPRVVPAEIYRNRNISTLHTFPTGLNLKNSQEKEVDSNEELLYQAPSDGSQSVDGQCHYEEMDGWTGTGEGKRPLLQFPLQLTTKLLRFLWCPFPLQSLDMDLSLCFHPVVLALNKKSTLSSWLLLFNQPLVFSVYSVVFPCVLNIEGIEVVYHFISLSKGL